MSERRGVGGRGGEGKGRKEGKEESVHVAAHYILGSSVGSGHGSLACGWSVFVCVDFIM